MGTVTTWLKHLGGALFACLLLASFVTPAVGAALCLSDPMAVASDQLAAEAPTVIESDAEDSDAQEEGERQTCVEGHCHHATPLIGADVASLAAQDINRVRLVPAAPGIPPSLAPARLHEPPRV
ncbi:hypothetical protein [Caulobacter henricii]|uniref:Cobalt transporter n=1 Tax=Caulobacter henricii TaxID=69395 RepID=A0A0P0P4B3_9CAUL|nr:hypothetical protein [Caulobacter henricii]ALL15484.1 hypothetical protein AQ619_18540 [Caulobacter henricii]